MHVRISFGQFAGTKAHNILCIIDYNLRGCVHPCAHVPVCRSDKRELEIQRMWCFGIALRECRYELRCEWAKLHFWFVHLHKNAWLKIWRLFVSAVRDSFGVEWCSVHWIRSVFLFVSTSDVKRRIDTEKNARNFSWTSRSCHRQKRLFWCVCMCLQLLA